MEFSAQQIALLLGGKITGDANRKVSDVGAIESAKEGQLTFLCDAKYIHHLPTTQASVVLMTDSIPFDGETDANLGLADYTGFGASVDLDKLSDEQRDIYEQGYLSGKDNH